MSKTPVILGIVAAILIAWVFLSRGTLHVIDSYKIREKERSLTPKLNANWVTGEIFA